MSGRVGQGVDDGEELILLLLDGPELAQDVGEAGVGGQTVGSHGMVV